MNAVTKGVLAALIVLFSAGVGRCDSVVQLSLWAPKLQLASPERTVSGLRLQIYGRNMGMNGLDLGLANETTGNFAGLGVGLLNTVEGDMKGLQWSFFGYGRVEGNVYGVASGLASVTRGDLFGLQEGCAALADQDVYGCQFALAYARSGGDHSGAQLSLVNRARRISGFQLGIVNLAESMRGIQIGLWNQIDSKTSLKVFPIINWSF
jgi:hypothetical protein